MKKNIPITVMIFTLNEAINLPNCLNSLTNFDDIIVIDSYSTDQTETICKGKNIRFFQHPFEGFGSQRNWALEHIPVKYDWILILDADERLTPELANEMRAVVINAHSDIAGFRLKRRFYMWGRWLRYSNLYPVWLIRLIHKDKCRYLNRGHAETAEYNGIIKELKHDLIDENLKGIDEWFFRQNIYARKEAEYELSFNSSHISSLKTRRVLQKLSRHLPARGFFYFMYAYFWRKGFLEGRDGFVFCLMKAIAQTTIAIKKYDIKKQKNTPVVTSEAKQSRTEISSIL